MKLSNYVKDIVKIFIAYSVPLNQIIKSKRLIKKYKGKYEGQRCFIIGNGPSLNKDDLNKLCGEITFAANRIYYMFNKTSWRPTFYCIQDRAVTLEMGDELLRGSSEAKATFIRMKAYSDVKKFFRKIKDVILIPMFITDSNTKIRFTDRADKHIYDGWNVTYMAMQLAVYMGFSDIYLLGVDFSYPIQKDIDGNVVSVDKSIKAHFYESNADNKSTIYSTHRDRTLAYYVAAEEYSKKSGKFRIFNATRGGKLEVYKRVDFDSLF